MARNPLIAGNWKMNLTVDEARGLVGDLIAQTDDISPVEVAVCPPATALYTVGKLLKRSETKIQLGAQDMFIQPSGAFTGMVAPGMLLEVGCSYVIVGHSERRGRFGTLEPWMTPNVLRLFGDNDETVGAKAKVALDAGITPIICCGETIDERRAGQTDTIVASQVKAALSAFSPEQVGWLAIAYEPVWAIGTGEVCESGEAERVCALIRTAIGEVTTSGSDAVRILYGGSVKPDNAEDLLAQDNIDGALVGGASLKLAQFAPIVRAAHKTFHGKS